MRKTRMLRWMMIVQVEETVERERMMGFPSWDGEWKFVDGIGKLSPVALLEVNQIDLPFATIWCWRWCRRWWTLSGGRAVCIPWLVLMRTTQIGGYGIVAYHKARKQDVPIVCHMWVSRSSPPPPPNRTWSTQHSPKLDLCVRERKQWQKQKL